MANFGISAKNEEQKAAIQALTSNKPFVFLTGPAGTGKTLISQAVGLENVIENRKYRKLIYTRLQVQTGKDIGALPGNIDEKTYPFIAPFMDSLEVMTSKPGEIKKYFGEGPDDDKRKIFFDSIQAIRGRSLNHVYLLADEAQNLDIFTIAAIATRIGTNAKIVFLGNFSQIDSPNLRTPEQNGLYKLLSGLYAKNAHDFFSHVNLTETLRNPVIEVVEDILRNHKMSPEFEELEARGGVDFWKNTLTS